MKRLQFWRNRVTTLLFFLLSCSHAYAQDTELVNCANNSPWCKTFFFGVQFLPDYEKEDDGSFSGLNKQAFFGHFNFDAIKKNAIDSDRFKSDNFGFNISLFESGSIKEDENASIPSSFNQISGTVSLEGYYSLNLWGTTLERENAAGVVNPIATASGSTYGFRTIVGAITRNDVLESEDTLSTYTAIGFQYQFYDQLPSLDKNSIPTGEFFIGAAYFENWAGRDLKLSDIDEDGRLLLRGSYNIGGQWFMGISANGGRGPDDVAIFFGTRKTTDELLSFIGLKK